MATQLTVMAIEYGFAGRPTTQLFYKDEIVLGRDASSDVVLNRPEISSRHAKITVKRNGKYTEPGLFIRDLSSSNGTMMGSKTLEANADVAIQPNERIIIGNFLIRSAFLDIDPPQAEKPEAEIIENAIELKAGKLREETRVAAEGNLPQEKVGIIRGQSKETTSNLFPAHEVTVVQDGEKNMGILDDYRSDFGEQSSQDSGATKVNKWSIFGGEKSISGTDYEPVKEVKREEPLKAEQVVTEAAVVAEVLEAKSAPKAAEAAPSASTDEVVALNIDFDAIQLFSVAGKVSYRGAPLANVEVFMGSLSRITGDDGRFVFEDIEDGTRYDLRAEKQGYVFKCEAPSGTISSDVEVVFTAKQLFVIRGRVTHRGIFLDGVRVDAGAWGSVVTTQDGAYCISNVPEGSGYALVASKDGYIFECDTPSGILGQADEIVDFSAKKLLTITGRITHKGFPLAGVEIDGGPIGKTITGHDGTYRFEKVPEGTDYKLVARREGFTFGKK